MMALTAIPPAQGSWINYALFFALILVMMVAMMLPAAVPMIIAFHEITRLEEGRPTRPADTTATAIFVLPYFLVWGSFGFFALLGLMSLGLVGPFGGMFLLIPAATFIGAGGYQLTKVKETCLGYCQSPMSFVMEHWQDGRLGALAMGLRHASYCLGCCWLFMIVLFVAGSMSLLWMGLLSILIFGEKVGIRRLMFSRAIAGALIILGVWVVAQSIFVG